MPFCQGLHSFYNFKKLRPENYIIFSTTFQLRILAQAQQLYIDGTFRSSPRNFYQILVIQVYDSLSFKVLPVMFILMSSKSKLIYKNLFVQIGDLLASRSYNVNWKIIHTDFETSIYKAIKSLHPTTEFMGCYFHFVKSLWKHAKKYQLTDKSKIQLTKHLIFFLKQLPLSEIRDRKKYYDKFKYLVTRHIKTTNRFKSSLVNYTKFFDYYDKQWINYRQKWSDYFENDVEITRTNNNSEIFNRKLNQLVQIRKPKITYLMSILMNITCREYENYMSSIGKSKEAKITEIDWVQGQNNTNELFMKLEKSQDIIGFFLQPFFKALSKDSNNYQEYIDNDILDYSTEELTMEHSTESIDDEVE